MMYWVVSSDTIFHVRKKNIIMIIRNKYFPDWIILLPEQLPEIILLIELNLTDYKT